MVWWALWLACAGDDDPTTDTEPTEDTGPSGTDPGALTDLVAVPSEVVPTTFQATWTTTGSGTSYIEYGLGRPDEFRTPSTGAGTSHRVRVVGLKNNRDWQWRAVTELPDGTRLQSGVNTFRTPPIPSDLPLLHLDAAESSATVTDGWVVTTLIDARGGWAVVIDGDADVVWWYDTGHEGRPPPDLVASAPPGWDGHTLPVSSRIDPATGSLLVQFYDGNQTDDVATLRRIPLDAMTPEDVVTTRTAFGHHDFVLHSDEGRVGWLAYQTAEIGGEVWASDVLLEGPEGTRGVSGLMPIWGWLYGFPHEPYAFDPLQGPLPALDADREWTHSNSLMFDAASDKYFVMSKFLDCLVKIDRRTGALEWTLGGQYSDFTLPGGAPVWEGLDQSHLWSHAHMSHLWYDAATRSGGFVLFDNGYYYPALSGVGEGWSRLSEYTFDEDTRTVEKVWELLEPDGAFTALMGDVRKLSEDRYLAGWSSLGRVEELDRDGGVHWRVGTPLGAITGRVSYTAVLHPDAM